MRHTEQGRDEADDAFNTAENLGLFGEKIIYYDMEAYSGDDKCRNTVKSLHTRLDRAAARPGQPRPAATALPAGHISRTGRRTTRPRTISGSLTGSLDRYDPSATVWDAVCLDPTTGPPEYWLNHQRLRQYAGGHTEWYGGVPLTIDSNVLDGEVFDMELAGAGSQAAPE